MSTASTPLVRVERGRASDEELAAVTALLMARATAPRQPAGDHVAAPGRSRAGWRRLERSPGFHAPHSWRH
ncbi:acyl-CoA carboxylase subunit epsilon [Streptomyces sp. TR06-5]|uniref:acyl-CoA carboxylase subunit epsilon n=1 Tax=unclassified Streptomyces TaxID=2593676 RepID=UPI00399FA003